MALAAAVLLVGLASQVDEPALVAPDASSVVLDAVKRYDLAQFHGLISELEAALRREDLTPELRLLALAYLARTYAVFRLEQDATRTFADLLALDPSFEIDRAESPLIQSAYRAARDQAHTAAPGPPEHGAPAASSAQRGALAPTALATTGAVGPADYPWLPWVGAAAVVVIAGVVTGVLLATAGGGPSVPVGTLGPGQWRLP